MLLSLACLHRALWTRLPSARSGSSCSSSGSDHARADELDRRLWHGWQQVCAGRLLGVLPLVGSVKNIGVVHQLLHDPWGHWHIRRGFLVKEFVWLKLATKGSRVGGRPGGGCLWRWRAAGMTRLLPFARRLGQRRAVRYARPPLRVASPKLCHCFRHPGATTRPESPARSRGAFRAGVRDSGRALDYGRAHGSARRAPALR